MIVVLLRTEMFVASVKPSLTVAPATKPVPLIVTDVPPFVLPEFGVMSFSEGAGRGTAA